MYYPIVLNITDRRVVVIGGGAVAEDKVRNLIESGANVTVISPVVTPALRSLATSTQITLIDRPYKPSDIRGAFFVIAATDDMRTQERIWRDTRKRHVLVNTVDERGRCDFIMPSVLRREHLIVAISTSGKSPAFAAWLQKKLSEWLTPEFGRVVEMLGSVRGEIKRRFASVPERKRVFQKIIDTDIVNWIQKCDDVAALRRVHAIIEQL